MTGRAQDVLDFWFGPDPLAPKHLPHRLVLWFGDGLDARDRIHQDRALVLAFGPLIRAAAEGELDHWGDSPRRLLALLLLLDQFPRHAFRGRARAFAHDHRAMALVLDGLATGADAALAPVERLFFYLPLQHAESADVQEESVGAYRRLAADAGDAGKGLFTRALESAEAHREVIGRFGRFPQRNAALGRTDTEEESVYIKKAPQW